jgi:hypothetical protein
MPRLQRKTTAQAERFEFTEAICVEGFRSGFIAEIPRGRVYPRTHTSVIQHPEFWRLLGPRPDQEVNGDA